MNRNNIIPAPQCATAGAGACNSPLDLAIKNYEAIYCSLVEELNQLEQVLAPFMVSDKVASECEPKSDAAPEEKSAILSTLLQHNVDLNRIGERIFRIKNRVQR